MADKPKSIFSRIFNSQEPQKSIDPIPIHGKKEELLSKYSLEYIEYAIEFEQTLSSLES